MRLGVLAAFGAALLIGLLISAVMIEMADICTPDRVHPHSVVCLAP